MARKTELAPEYERLAKRAALNAKHYLRAIRKLGDSNNIEPEDVHAARVSGRRLVAVLRLMKPLLPQQYVKLSKRIRRTTRSLGELRDADIISARIEQCGGKVAEQIVQQLRSARAEREGDVRSTAHKFLEKKSPGLIENLIQREWIMGHITHQRDERHAFPRANVAQVLDEFACAREVALRRRDYSSLHELRKVGKRVRYAVELLLPEGKPTAALLRECKNLQDDLGILHDAWAAAEEIRRREAEAEMGEEYKALLGSLDGIRDAMRSDFVKKWIPDRLSEFETRIVHSTACRVK